MTRNIEIKAHIHQRSQIEEIAQSLSGSEPTLIKQEDIFFPTTHGRLKLRILSTSSGKLIFYQRDNINGPKTSTYEIVETDTPNQLRLVLAAAYGEATIVRKLRRLYMVGRTRIHIDTVEGLGEFLELEVMLNDDEGTQAGEIEANDLMQKLGVASDDLIDGAYADLLPKK